MAKGRKSRNVLDERASAGRAARRLARLEDRLGKVRARIAVRRRQLDDLRGREDRIQVRIDELRHAEPESASVDESAGSAPQAYCMRDKRRVTIRNPVPKVLSNGRHAISGTCAECGAAVVAIVAAPASP